MNYHHQKQTQKLDTISEQKENTPVKLGSYMAERQASKGKEVINKIRSTQFVSKLEAAGIQIDTKRDIVVRLIQKLIDQLIKKKKQLENSVMEELYEEERVIEGMLQMINTSQRQKIANSEYFIKQKIKKSGNQTSNCIRQVSKKNMSQNYQANSEIKQLAMKVVDSNGDLQKKKVGNELQADLNRIKSWQSILQKPFGTKKRQTILRNGSATNMQSQFHSIKPKNHKLSQLELKLQSRVRFRND